MAEHMSGSGSARVHKVSVFDQVEPDALPAELEKYPGGVLTEEQWQQTGLGGVPAYIVVEGGVVREAGILSPEKIAELTGRYRKKPFDAAGAGGGRGPGGTASPADFEPPPRSWTPPAAIC